MLFRFYIRLKAALGFHTGYELELLGEAAARCIDADPTVAVRYEIHTHSRHANLHSPKDHLLYLAPRSEMEAMEGHESQPNMECEVCTMKFSGAGGRSARCPSCGSQHVGRI